MSDLILLETGTDYLLQETGDKIILVFIPAPPAAPAAARLSGWMPWEEKKKKPKPEPIVLVEPNLIIKMRT